MPNLLASFASSADALRTYQLSLDVIENNVSNASTPGFARQRQSLQARSFAPEFGLVGGVSPGTRQSARSDFAEQAVRRQNSSLGHFDQLSNVLSQVEGIFSANGACTGRSWSSPSSSAFPFFSRWVSFS